MKLQILLLSVMGMTISVYGGGLLQNVGTNKCLAIAKINAGNWDGSPNPDIVGNYAFLPCDQTNPNQIFQVMALEDAEETPVHLRSLLSDKCPEPAGNGGVGTEVVQWNCVEDKWRKWTINNGDFGDKFQLATGVTGLCLTPGSAGITIQVQTCNPSNSRQFWRVIPTQEACGAVQSVCTGQNPLLL